MENSRRFGLLALTIFVMAYFAGRTEAVRPQVVLNGEVTADAGSGAQVLANGRRSLLCASSDMSQPLSACEKSWKTGSTEFTACKTAAEADKTVAETLCTKMSGNKEDCEDRIILARLVYLGYVQLCDNGPKVTNYKQGPFATTPLPSKLPTSYLLGSDPTKKPSKFEDDYDGPRVVKRSSYEDKDTPRRSAYDGGHGNNGHGHHGHGDHHHHNGYHKYHFEDNKTPARSRYEGGTIVYREANNDRK